jgi:hypothetical protein
MLAQIGECSLRVIHLSRVAEKKRHSDEAPKDFCDKSNYAKFMPSGSMLVILLPDKL